MIDSLLGGKYRIERVLGAGGMGSVYAAVDVRTGARVAVKVIHAHLTGDTTAAVQRFEREARAAGAIDTEHIARCLDTGTDPASNNPYMVLEYLVGEDLQHLVRRLGPMPPELALRVTAQACMGLSVAHQASIIHRDIKPANIFITRAAEGRHVVKLLDFGVAKVRRDPSDMHSDTAGLTQTGSILGSPLYMSPEQARSVKNVDHRSDIWSMGVVLYQALAGRTPYEHISGLGDLILSLCSDLPPPVQQFAPWVDPAIAAVVDRALRIDTRERWQSAAEMLGAIEALLPAGTEIRDDMMVPLDDATHDHIAPTYFRSLSGATRSASAAPSSAVEVAAPRSNADAGAPALEVSSSTARSQPGNVTQSAVATTGPGLGATSPGTRGKTLPLAAMAVACVIAGGAGVYAFTRPGPVPAVTASMGAPSAAVSASAAASASPPVPTVTVSATASAAAPEASVSGAPPLDSASAKPASSAPLPKPRSSATARPNRPDHTSYGDRK